jgi:hypothetical protein
VLYIIPLSSQQLGGILINYTAIFDHALDVFIHFALAKANGSLPQLYRFWEIGIVLLQTIKAGQGRSYFPKALWLSDNSI